MKTVKTILALGLTLPALLPLHPVATAGSQEKAQQHGAHVHGEAVLNLVIEGQSVFAELQTPAANVLGFEHQPSTAEQRNAVNQALQLLEKHANVFQFNAGDCRQTSSDIDTPFEEKKQKHQHDEHAHKHGHAHHHEETEHHKEHDTHSEFQVIYNLACVKPETISTVEITAFKHFPGFEKVRIQWVGPKGQGMREAEHSQTQVSIKQ